MQFTCKMYYLLNMHVISIDVHVCVDLGHFPCMLHIVCGFYDNYSNLFYNVYYLGTPSRHTRSLCILSTPLNYHTFSHIKFHYIFIILPPNIFFHCGILYAPRMLRAHVTRTCTPYCVIYDMQLACMYETCMRDACVMRHISIVLCSNTENISIVW